MNPGRGGLILTLGILSIICCAPLGMAAWIMGMGDLRKIEAGIIDREAKSLTQAGMICGIIGSIALIVAVVWGCIGGVLLGAAVG